MPHPTPQGETISAHEPMSTDKTERAAFDAYPPLPAPTAFLICKGSEVTARAWNVDQMRAYVDADRKARAALPATVVQPATHVLIRATDGSGNTWGREEVAELARDLREACSSKVMSGERMRAKDADQDRGWCRDRMTFAALALESLAAHPSAPAESGWQWVPVEPAPAMLLAGLQCSQRNEAALYITELVDIYLAMLKAAPSAVQPGGADGGA